MSRVLTVSTMLAGATSISDGIFSLVVVLPAGQEVVVAIADFALQTPLVFAASNIFSSTFSLSLTNENKIQIQLKCNTNTIKMC